MTVGPFCIQEFNILRGKILVSQNLLGNLKVTQYLGHRSTSWLFHNAFSIQIGSFMNYEFEKIWKESVVA
jgi:predicted 3-demethylubiquinone-9 3-methyltransferase (glyoxalase superfamily)